MFMRFVGSALLIELVVQSLIVLVIVILNWENIFNFTSLINLNSLKLSYFIPSQLRD